MSVQRSVPERTQPPWNQRMLDQAVLLAFGVLLSVAVFLLRLLRPARKPEEAK